jgi:hypothetical protein
LYPRSDDTDETRVRARNVAREAYIAKNSKKAQDYVDQLFSGSEVGTAEELLSEISQDVSTPAAARSDPGRFGIVVESLPPDKRALLNRLMNESFPATIGGEVYNSVDEVLASPLGDRFR